MPHEKYTKKSKVTDAKPRGALTKVDTQTAISSNLINSFATLYYFNAFQRFTTWQGQTSNEI